MLLSELMDTLPHEIKNEIMTKSFVKGEYVIFQGEINEYLYIILEGEIEVFTESHHGSHIKLRDHSSPDAFGVLELFKSSLKTQSCVAKTNCTVLKLHKNYVLKWMAHDFKFNLYIIDLLLECYSQSNEISLSLSTMSAKERFLRIIYLHHLDGTLGQVDKDILMKEIVIQLRSLNRIIKDCQAQGYIKYINRTIYVDDLNKLEDATSGLL